MSANQSSNAVATAARMDCRRGVKRRPASVIVWPNGVPWELDIIACRRALVLRQVAGDFDSMEGLAKKVGCSRSTASRFFSGRPTSLKVILAILGVLKLKFENVTKPWVPDI